MVMTKETTYALNDKIIHSTNKGKFKLEERYIVIKRKRLTEDQIVLLLAIAEATREHVQDCVVIEESWPEYDIVLDMLKARIEGKQVLLIPKEFKSLYYHAKGLSNGVDWNNGTAASYHRANLVNAIEACTKLLDSLNE